MTASKDAGTRFETAVVRFLNHEGVQAYRTALTGRADEGDVVVPHWGAVLECKAGKRHDLAGATHEAAVEAHNAGKPFGIAVIKKRMAGTGDAYVVMPLGKFIELMQRP